MKKVSPNRFGSLSSLGRGTGKLKVFTNSKGEICLGNKCFRMRAADDGIHVAFNPNAKGCPTDMDKVLAKFTEIVKEGKPTNYRLPRAQEEGW